MKAFYLKGIIFLFIVLCCLGTAKKAYAQLEVEVDINSGDPNYPFPQFQPYEGPNGHYLGNLATQNPSGVTHVEMEQRMRDAWQIMANRFLYTGESHAGVDYIQGNIGVGDCGYDCTEGDGYALIMAALMGDKTTFDGLWMRTHDVRRVKKP